MNQAQSTPPYFPWLHRLSVAGLIVTIALTCGIGGTITSAEVGMAYPTWPDINGSSLFNMLYGKLANAFGVGSVVEHTHRQAASLTGLLILLLALVSWFTAGVSRRMRMLTTASLLLVTGQGLLGAGRVTENDYLIAILHAVGAQFVVLLLVVMAKCTAPDWHRPPLAFPPHRVARLRLWSGVALVLLFLNLFAAASLRHKQGAFEGHLVLAITTSVVVLFLIQQALTKFRGHKRIARTAKGLAHMLGTQLALGVAAWAFLLGPLVGSFQDDDTRFLMQSLLATAHLLCGILVLNYVTALWMEVRHRVVGEPSA
ncbi:MAG: COX15/CtaA family protein [Planctomycetota bacterium]